MMKKKLAFLLATVIFFSFLASCKSENDSTFVYYINEEPITLDPQTVNDKSGRFLTVNLFEGLFSINEKGEVVPAAVESYSYDNGIYTFNLKKGLLWSDGKALTAMDFVFAFKRLFDPKTKAPDAVLFFAIKNAREVYSGEMNTSEIGVFATDEHTLKISVNYEDPYFLRYLTYPAAMPCNEEFFLSTKGRYGLEYIDILTNGAFKIANWKHNESIGLRRNLNYRNADDVPKVLSVFISDEETSKKEFAEGNNIALFSSVKQNSFTGSKYTEDKVLESYSGIVFNTQSEFFKNKDLRLALSLSFDRKSYKAHLSESKEVDESFIYKDLSNFSYNPESAKAHFEASGVNREEMSGVKLISLKGSGDKELLSYAVQVWQKDLGVFFGITELEAAEYYSALASGEYDAAVVSYHNKSDGGISVLKSFYSTAENNYSNFNNPEYDSVVLNKDSAIKLLSDEVLFLPSCINYSYIYKQKNTENLHYNPEFSVLDFKSAKN